MDAVPTPAEEPPPPEASAAAAQSSEPGAAKTHTKPAPKAAEPKPATEPKKAEAPKAAEPKPKAAEAPPPEAAPQTGRVSVTGGVNVTLTNAAGRRKPGNVPPGTYTLQAFFDPMNPIDAGTVTVEAGGSYTLSCSKSMMMCNLK